MYIVLAAIGKNSKFLCVYKVDTELHRNRGGTTVIVINKNRRYLASTNDVTFQHINAVKNPKYSCFFIPKKFSITLAMASSDTVHYIFGPYQLFCKTNDVLPHIGFIT